jgi:hypothetical protein
MYRMNFPIRLDFQLSWNPYFPLKRRAYLLSIPPKKDVSFTRSNFLRGEGKDSQNAQTLLTCSESNNDLDTHDHHFLHRLESYNFSYTSLGKPRVTPNF